MPRVKSCPSFESSSVDCVKQRFPCRDDVINGLERRLTTIKLPFILIEGTHSTGKTSITRATLEALNFPFSWTNCLEVENLKSLQFKILYDTELVINDSTTTRSNLLTRVSNESFINVLVESLEKITAKTLVKTPIKSIAKKTPTKSKETRPEADAAATYGPKIYRYFVVLDNYDKLVESNIDILSILNQVHQMMKTKVLLVTIMISSLYSDQLTFNLSIPKPIVFTFPCFNLKKLPEVLSRLVNDEIDETYHRFNEFVCSILSASIGDLDILSSISETAFMDIIDDMDNMEDLSEMEIHKRLRKCFLDRVEEYERSIISHGESFPAKISTTLQELPKSTKYLLISAFLASYNPKSTDRKFFVISSDKRKVARSSTRKEKPASAPKLFTLERLLHIYEALIFLNESHNVNLNETLLNQPTNQLLSQIETLVDLKLLIKVNSVTISPLSSLIKFQVSDFITYQFMDSLAQSVDINLQGHLDGQ